MSRKLVIEFESDSDSSSGGEESELEYESESEEEKDAPSEYDEIKTRLKIIEFEDDEIKIQNLLFELNIYIADINFQDLVKDEKIAVEFSKIFSWENRIIPAHMQYIYLLSRSMEANNDKKMREKYNKEKNKPFKTIPDVYLKSVLSQIHPDRQIISDGLATVKKLLDPLISLFDLGEYPPTIKKVEELKNSIRDIIHGRLADHAIREITKTITGEKSNYIRHVVIEYLMAEILEISGNVAREDGKKRITSDHIDEAIDHDEELKALFRSDKIKEVVKKEIGVSVCDFYDSINNKFKVFSNFSDTPVKIDGVTWPTTEHYYHAEKFKAENKEDSEDVDWYQDKIREASTANKSKMLGNQKITGRFGSKTFLSPKDKTLLSDIIKESKDRGVSMRDDWEEVKDSVMYKAVKAKLEQHPDVKKVLLSTKDRIIREASPTDLYWGVGKNITGKNMLGNIYMKLRDEYRKVEHPMDYYQELTKSTKNIKITSPSGPETSESDLVDAENEGSEESKDAKKKKEEPKEAKKKNRAYELVTNLEGLPKSGDAIKDFYYSTGRRALNLLDEEDLNKYTISELKGLVGFFNNGIFGEKKKYVYTDKKKADFVNDLKSLMKDKKKVVFMEEESDNDSGSENDDESDDDSDEE